MQRVAIVREILSASKNRIARDAGLSFPPDEVGGEINSAVDIANLLVCRAGAAEEQTGFLGKCRRRIFHCRCLQSLPMEISEGSCLQLLCCLLSLWL